MSGMLQSNMINDFPFTTCGLRITSCRHRRTVAGVVEGGSFFVLVNHVRKNLR